MAGAEMPNFSAAALSLRPDARRGAVWRSPAITEVEMEMGSYSFVVRRPLLLAGLSLLLAPATPWGPVAAAQESDQEWLERCRDEARWGDRDRERYCQVRVETLPATGRLEARSNPNGGVSVRGWDRDHVEVHARIHASARTEEEAARIACRVEPDVVGSSLGVDGTAMGHREHWPAMLVVYVPRQYALDLAAHNGPLAVREVSGRMDLYTQNGPLMLRGVSGDVTARTQNGPLSIVLEGTRWEGEGLDAETRNSSLTLRIPEGYSATLEAGTTNGPQSIGFPITVTLGGETDQGRGRGARYRATLGNGGPPIRAITTNGPLVIERP